MTNIWFISSISFLLALFLVFVVIPLVSRIGNKFNFIDKPDARKQHNIKIVRIGGISIIFAVYIAIAFYTLLENSSNNLILESLNSSFVLTVFFGGLLFYLVGLFDDIFNISPFLRLFFQFLVSIFIWNKGIAIDSLYIAGFDDNYILIIIPKILSLVFTSLWIIGVTNAINWMDGLDGLASGIASITSITIFGISLVSGDLTTAIISASISGACLGFIFYNRYPSYIYMGDGGSNFIGFMLAILTLNVSYEKVNSIQMLQACNIFLLVGILLLPILDMILVIFRRLYLGKSPFFPDRNHMHHKLLKAGLSHKKTVHTMHFITSLILFFNLLFLQLDINIALLPIYSFIFIYLFSDQFWKSKYTENNDFE